MTDHIREFTRQYKFLSNFHIEPDGTHVEGEFQAYKVDPPDRKVMRMPPKQARAVGRRLPLRPDWDSFRLVVMHALVLRKFIEHPSLTTQLLATRDAYLEEGNYWGDRFWGTVDGVGENHLGRILMQVRGELMS